MTTLTKTNRDIYKDESTDTEYECKKRYPYNLQNGGKDGFFFGQGNTGKTYGIIAIFVIIVLTIAFFSFDMWNTDKDQDSILHGIIHVFGFSFWNMCFLLLIFLMAPFGYQFWVGRCKNDHPGKILNSPTLDNFLAAMPFIASIVLVVYPASLILSGNITNWGHKSGLILILAIFGSYSSLEYWPAFIKNAASHKSCVTGTGEFSPTVFTFVFWLGFAIVGAFVLALSIKWVMMAINSDIEVGQGFNPIGVIRNLLITLGLVLTNLFGGLKLYEAKDFSDFLKKNKVNFKF